MPCAALIVGWNTRDRTILLEHDSLADDVSGAAEWEAVLAARRAGRPLAEHGEAGGLGAIYAPLLSAGHGVTHVVAQLGQSLDGRIATASGDSHYINCVDGLVHLHRLRALCDAVVVGVGTALADDCRLTVRRVAGPDPARVVLDPRGRLPDTARLLAENGARRIVVSAAARRLGPGIELIRLDAGPDGFGPGDVVAALAERGLKTILVEGGSLTLSRFFAAGAIDRLHLMVAPMIIGSGPCGLSLPPIARLADAVRPSTRVHRLGRDILFDCALKPGQDRTVPD